MEAKGQKQADVTNANQRIECLVAVELINGYPHRIELQRNARGEFVETSVVPVASPRPCGTCDPQPS